MARFICISGLYFFFGLTKLGSCSIGCTKGAPGGGGTPESNRGGATGGTGNPFRPANEGGGGTDPGGGGGGGGRCVPLLAEQRGPPDASDELIAAPSP